MKFMLHQDKLVIGERNTLLTFLDSGTYEIVRMFDKDRVLVNTNYSTPRQLTVLNLKDGEIV